MKQSTPMPPQVRNPHFDDDLVIWNDSYSGRYKAPPSTYGDQFDLQWRLAFELGDDWLDHPGAGVADHHIQERIFEWTGHRHDCINDSFSENGVRELDHPIDVALISGRRCIDIGCGMGRWTRTMQQLGALSVTSVDISQAALESTRRFNPDTHMADLMNLPQQKPEWIGRYEFACFWGVAHHTHDPRKAFASAASTLSSTGSIYLMVYSPEGIHGRPLTTQQRKNFSSLNTLEDRLSYVDQVYNRRYHKSYRKRDNLLNFGRNFLRRPKGGRLAVLDMLEPFYNWVIPYSVIEDWMSEHGFTKITLLNEFESPKCAWHVLGQRG